MSDDRLNIGQEWKPVVPQMGAGRDHEHPRVAFLGRVRLTPTGTTTTASATLVDWPAAASGGPVTLSIVKRRGDTNLLVEVLTGFYVTGGASFASINFAVSVDGVDQSAVRLSAKNTAGDHDQTGGSALVTGVAAGPHTLRFRASRGSGDRTVTCDTEDRMQMLCWEVLAE